MFYLIKEEFGRKVCLSKNPNDIYQDGFFTDCGTDITRPSNIKQVRDLTIKCNDIPGSNSKSASVYTDFFTARKLNIV